MNLNDKDEQMIALLRRDGRMPVSELARRLSVSRTAAQMRLSKLERNGVIAGYGAVMSPQYLGQRLRALVMMKFQPGARQGIERALADMPQVSALYSISGTFDLAGVISAGSMADLDHIIDRIGCLDGMGETMSSVILSTKIDR